MRAQRQEPKLVDRRRPNGQEDSTPSRSPRSVRQVVSQERERSQCPSLHFNVDRPADMVVGDLCR